MVMMMMVMMMLMLMVAVVRGGGSSSLLRNYLPPLRIRSPKAHRLCNAVLRGPGPFHSVPSFS